MTEAPIEINFDIYVPNPPVFVYYIKNMLQMNEYKNIIKPSYSEAVLKHLPMEMS